MKREIKEEFNIDIDILGYLGENVHHYNHGSIKLLVYRAHWRSGKIILTDHADFQWVTPSMLGNFDFAQADILFAEKLRRGEIEL